MKCLPVFLILVGFAGPVFAEQGELHPEPTPACAEGSVLKENACVKAEPICGQGTTYQNGVCVVSKVGQNVSSSSRWGPSPYNNNIMSPLDQMHSGVSPDKVDCGDDLELVQKHNGIAACVGPGTREKLIQRSWAVDFPMKYVIDRGYWGKTYLVHHTMCAHVGVWEQSAEKMKGRPVWHMTDADLEKIPIIKTMIDYNSHGLYSSSEYPITSTVVPDEVQNQHRHAFGEIANSKSDDGDSEFWYEGKYYDASFSIC